MLYLNVCIFLLFISNCYGYPEVFKKVLSNNFEILVAKTNTSQKISCQIFYRVGSKHELSNEKGIAHLLEHMCFKGTNDQSESDIPLLTHKLSAYSNAATSYDWTKYYFNVPIKYWKHILPVMADCMQNCTFKQDLLNAEYKAVFQELRMGKDNYQKNLFEALMNSLFYDHPYHYPVIGYKHDLWHIASADLHNFYKKYYGPNNAVLVVVGNVDPEEIFQEAEKLFGSIPQTKNQLPEMPIHYDDMGTKSITLYRDIETPFCFLAYTIPGLREGSAILLELLITMLFDGKNSRLQESLVYKNQLVRHIGAQFLQLFDYDLFLIAFQPYDEGDIEKIIGYINETLGSVAQGNIELTEINKAYKKLQTNVFSIMENNTALANLIGKLYLATGDVKTAFEQVEKKEDLRREVAAFTQTYLRPIRMNTAVLLPLPDYEKNYWLDIQKKQDLLDAKILQERVRQSDIEPPRYADKINLVINASQVKYPQPTVNILENNITVLTYNNPDSPTFKLVMSLKANGEYDSLQLPGLYRIVCMMLRECGTKKHSALQLAELLESHAIRLKINPESITVKGLIEDLPLALTMVTEILTDSEFNEQTLMQVKQWALTDCKSVNDSPAFHADRLLMGHFYKNHPFSKNRLGTEESINSITLDDVINFYNKYISPDQATVALVGDFHKYDLVSLLKNSLGVWQGTEIEQLSYEPLEKPKADTLKHLMDRDQVLLTIAGPSIERLHPDYDKLLIFNRIFGQGMHSLLFQLREKTGLFYSISGSLTEYSSHQPGLWTISCLVTPEKVEEAKQLITQAIKHATETLTVESVEEAKQEIINAADDLYSTNSSIAAAFLHLAKYKLPWDYLEKRAEILAKITLDDIKQAVGTIFDLNHAVTIQVGKV